MIDKNIQKIPLSSGPLTNEFDFQFENSVLDKLNEIPHYTYSVWPSSVMKKIVPLDIY